MSNLITLDSNTPMIQKPKSIVFISDLHFDFTKGKPNDDASKQIEDDFINYVKRNYQDHVLCLAGDYYDDYRKTMAFVKRLEKNEVTGFFVLGNHDFWNDRTMSYSEIIDLFVKETQNHHYFKFLTTGTKYYFGDICVIGDTGWTSFRSHGRLVDLSNFKYSLPDSLLVKEFSPKNIIKMHKKWIRFANKVLKEETKVLMITHFPMTDFTEEDRDCWWSSTTDLIEKDSWRIFGHTHIKKQQHFNNISSQRGYSNRQIGDFKQISEDNYHFLLSYENYLNEFKGDSDLKREYCVKQYTDSDFSELKPLFNFNSSITTYGFQNIKNFYNPTLISKYEPDLNEISLIKSRGYKRCAANKHNFAALAECATTYLEKVKDIMNGYMKNSYIGYTYSERVSYRVAEAVYHSIKIIEEGNISDVRSYMTAAVITGYVYNHMVNEIEDMRPLDDYDIIRFWLMFLTIQHFEINAYGIKNVIGQQKKKIVFQNVEIYLPAINDLSLEVDEVLLYLQQNTLLTTTPQISYNLN